MSHLRITGRPKIERDTNGLRRITRTYIVQGDAVTEGKVESEVFIPFGTPDLEYDDTITQDLTNGGLTNSEVTGAYLVEQSVSPGQNINEAVLTRVYQELDGSSDPVRVGKDEITLTGADRIQVKRAYIVKNPYSAHYQKGRVGVETITVAGATCKLGSVQSKATQVYTEFVEGWYEDGVLSESIDYKHGQKPNHRLELRTIRGIAKPSAPPASEGPSGGVGEPWFEIESREGPGNADYGQMGKTVYTVIFAKGEGLVEESSEVKGRAPNTVTLTTIRYLTTENGTVPPSAIPNFTRQTYVGKDEKDGYELHTIRGVVLNNAVGIVDITVDHKHGEAPDHKLEVVKAVSYGAAPTVNDVMTYLYPSGDPHSGLGNFVMVTEQEDTKGDFDVYTNVFARGVGVVAQSTRKVGLTEVSEIVSLQPAGTASGVPLGPNELTRKVDQKDGYEVLTVSTTTALTGIVDQRTESRYNDALEIITKTQLGSTWNAANTPAGFAEISERIHNYDIYPAITKVFAEGAGEISRTNRKVGLTTVTDTITLHDDSANPSPVLGTDELSKRIEEKDGYIVVHLSSTTGQTGLVDSRTETRHNGALIIKTLTQLGSTWNSGNTPAGYVEISTRDHSYDTYSAITKVYAKGDGQVLERTREEGSFTITTEVHLGTNVTIPANAFDESIEEESGHQKTTFSTRTATTNEDTSTRISDGLKFTTTSKINGATAGEVAGSKKHLGGGDFMGEKTDVEPDSFDEQSWNPVKAFVKRHSTTVITEIAPVDPGAGNYVDYDQVAPNIWKKTTHTYAADLGGQNQVILDQRTTYRAGYYLVTTTALGQKHNGGGALVDDVESADQYGITTYRTTEAFFNAKTYSMLSTASFTFPGRYVIHESGVSVVPPLTKQVPVVIDVVYSAVSLGGTTYTVPSASVMLKVTFHDDTHDYEFNHAASNYFIEQLTGGSWPNNETEFRGRAIETATLQKTGDTSFGASGLCIGYSENEVLVADNLVVRKCQTVTTV